MIGARRQNAALALGSLTLLAVANLALAPLYGVLGASIAVAVATLVWLIALAIVLARFDGLRTECDLSAPALTSVNIDGGLHAPRPRDSGRNACSSAKRLV
jgi:O-antigen/teichoic acid export membrane protein